MQIAKKMFIIHQWQCRLFQRTKNKSIKYFALESNNFYSYISCLTLEQQQQKSVLNQTLHDFKPGRVEESPTIKAGFILLSRHPALTSWTPHSKHLFSSTGSGVWQYRQTGHLPRTPWEWDRLNIKQLSYNPKAKHWILNPP